MSFAGSASKLVRKYEILLEKSHEFKLPQKIIGPEGASLKRILSKAAQATGLAGVDSLVKVRLRGKGSGFKEKTPSAADDWMDRPAGRDSDAPLGLYVSGKDPKVFQEVCGQVEQLLNGLVEDYKLAMEHKQGQRLEGLAYRVLEGKPEPLRQVRVCFLAEFPSAEFDGGLPSEEEVARLIGLRTNARRRGLFKEADAVRDRLKKRGVLLVDRPQGTSWKYIAK